MLSQLFECPMSEIDIGTYQYDMTDVAVAVKYTKMYLTTGVLPSILVIRQANKRYKIQTNVIAYIVAHNLSLSTIPAQEIT
jgi:hypothetical protein